MALKVKRLGINTGQEYIVYVREDCGICKSEGFEALSRVLVQNGKKSLVGTLNSIRNHLLDEGEVGVSESAWHELEIEEGAALSLSHPPPFDSLSKVRAKLYGHPLGRADFKEIIKDIKKGHYSNVQLAGFVSACVGKRLTIDEIIYLTEAMAVAGEKLHWDKEIVVDKHCVGGIPGNRVTPIVVSIVAAAGLTIPKTSSRAITSPSGTADTMETLTPVNLSIDQLKKVVNTQGGCFVWGGAVNLSPADDLIIRVERALDIDSEGQMIASVLSKKAAAGSTHVVLDIPAGPTAKVRTQESALDLKRKLTRVAHAVGLEVLVLITDGTEPIGNGIGPALEAHDILAVLEKREKAPKDLAEKSFMIAGAILELANVCEKGRGAEKAREILDSGKAAEKFTAICKAQGGLFTPPTAEFIHPFPAEKSGIIHSIDNRKLARIAKLAGAPIDKAAGIYLHAKKGTPIKKGEPLFEIHAESKGELDYALSYALSQKDIFQFEV